jgi:hypothetical protein
MARAELGAAWVGALLVSCSSLEPVEGSDVGVLATGRARFYFRHDEPRAGPYVQALALVTQGKDDGGLGAGEELRVDGQSLFGPASYDIDFDLRLLQVGVGARLAADKACVDAELGVESRAGKFEVTAPGYEARLDLDGGAFYLAAGVEAPFAERWVAAFRFSGSMAGGDAVTVVQLDGGVRWRLGAGLELAAGVGWLEAERTGGGDSDLVFSIFGPRVGLVWGW